MHAFLKSAYVSNLLSENPGSGGIMLRKCHLCVNVEHVMEAANVELDVWLSWT